MRWHIRGLGFAAAALRSGHGDAVGHHVRTRENKKCSPVKLVKYGAIETALRWLGDDDVAAVIAIAARGTLDQVARAVARVPRAATDRAFVAAAACRWDVFERFVVRMPLHNATPWDNILPSAVAGGDERVVDWLTPRVLKPASVELVQAIAASGSVKVFEQRFADLHLAVGPGFMFSVAPVLVERHHDALLARWTDAIPFALPEVIQIDDADAWPALERAVQALPAPMHVPDRTFYLAHAVLHGRERWTTVFERMAGGVIDVSEFAEYAYHQLNTDRAFSTLPGVAWRACEAHLTTFLAARGHVPVPHERAVDDATLLLALLRRTFDWTALTALAATAFARVHWDTLVATMLCSIPSHVATDKQRAALLHYLLGELRVHETIPLTLADYDTRHMARWQWPKSCRVLDWWRARHERV
jgi:hypothetical protein